MYKPDSRYSVLETLTIELPDGRVVRFTRRRFLPAVSEHQRLVDVVVDENDRVDTIAAKNLGDPEQFWRVADANGAMHPAELTARLGRVLRIPIPGFGGKP